MTIKVDRFVTVMPDGQEIRPPRDVASAFEAARAAIDLIVRHGSVDEALRHARIRLNRMSSYASLAGQILIVAELEDALKR